MGHLSARTGRTSPKMFYYLTLAISQALSERYKRTKSGVTTMTNADFIFRGVYLNSKMQLSTF